MSEAKTQNRWHVVLGAILIQLSLGAIYAWSVFTTPLKDAGWSKTSTQVVFSAGLASFAVVMVMAGRMMRRVGPRKLAISGGIVLGVGYLLAGIVGGTHPVLLTLFIGIVGGAGIGLAYVVPIAVGMRWFPDKKGLITGLAVAGFGFGAMLWVKLAAEWGHLLEDYGLRGTFAIYGAVFMIMTLGGGVWMTFPPEGYAPPGWKGSTQKTAGSNDSTSFTSREMLRTPQFYLIFAGFVFSASAGLMTIGLMKLFPKEALVANGLDPKQAGVVAGTAMAVFFSLANGVGRIAWGALSDKLGRRLSVVLMCLTQSVLMLAFSTLAGTPGTLYAAATLIGFNFGGNFALFPTLTADVFGAAHIGQNYGWVFLAYGVGGIFGPILGGKLGDMGNFPLAFTICGGLCLVAAGMLGIARAPLKGQRPLPPIGPLAPRGAR